MGPQLAERFGASQVTGTLLIREIDEEKRTVIAEARAGDRVLTVEADLPCLFTIEKANYHAASQSQGKMAAKKAQITTLAETTIEGLDPALIGVPGSDHRARIYPPELPEPDRSSTGAARPRPLKSCSGYSPAGASSEEGLKWRSAIIKTCGST